MKFSSFDAAILAPVLETERLRLRGRVLEDFSVFRKIWGDPVVTRHIGGKPLSEEEAWKKFVRAAGHWALKGYGYWVVEEKASGRIAGEVGFGEFKRTIEPSIKGEPEIGWVLGAHAHGKGIAGEAVIAALQWGDEWFGPVRMSCIIDPDNAPSIRVAEKAGFVETGRSVYHGETVVVMHREPNS